MSIAAFTTLFSVWKTLAEILVPTVALPPEMTEFHLHCALPSSRVTLTGMEGLSSRCSTRAAGQQKLPSCCISLTAAGAQFCNKFYCRCFNIRVLKTGCGSVHWLLMRGFCTHCALQSAEADRSATEANSLTQSSGWYKEKPDSNTPHPWALSTSPYWQKLDKLQQIWGRIRTKCRSTEIQMFLSQILCV